MKNNYGGLKGEFCKIESSKVVILPVPYDKTSTWVKGADKGPQKLLEASQNMELYDIETESEVYQKGIHTAEPVTENSSPEKLVKEVEKRVKKYLKKDKLTVCLGGEHSISIGSIYAHSKHFENLTVLQIDAHADTRESYHGSKNNHACVMARAREVANIVQIGIRSMDSSELEKMDERKMFFMKDIVKDSNWMEKAIKQMTDKVYITIDLDAFDPSILPSTGTPEPGGFDWYTLLAFLKKVIKAKKLVGFDVVELAPNEQDKSSDFLAAKLVYKILSYHFHL